MKHSIDSREHPLDPVLRFLDNQLKQAYKRKKEPLSCEVANLIMNMEVYIQKDFLKA